MEQILFSKEANPTYANPTHACDVFCWITFLAWFLDFHCRNFDFGFRTSSSEVKALATQTARLAQKGIAEEVAGLVGNASTLVDAMDQLVRTTRGIGIFLTVLAY